MFGFGAKIPRTDSSFLNSTFQAEYEVSHMFACNFDDVNPCVDNVEGNVNWLVISLCDKNAGTKYIAMTLAISHT